MNERNTTFPNGLQAFLLVVALFFAEYVVGAALYDFRNVLGIDPREVFSAIMVLANGCVFVVVMHVKGLTYRSLFHPSSSSPRATLLLLLPPILCITPALVLAMSAIMEIVVRVWPLSAWQEAMFKQMTSGSHQEILVTCMLAPILEEMLFRGVILRSFLTQYPRWIAIAGSAALFGLAHLNLYQFIVGAVLGALTGWLYERTRSLLPCIALHAAYNTALTVLSLTSETGSGSVDRSASLAIWGAALLVGAVGAYLLHRLLRCPPRASASD
jgi:uncharacterized protein